MKGFDWIARSPRLTPGTLVALAVLAVGAPDALTEGADKNKYNFLDPTPVDLLRVMTLDGPGATESPYTVDAGHFQVELTFYARSSYEQNFEGVTYTYDWWSVGLINLKAGLFNNLDLQVILEPYSHAVEREVGFFTARYSGMGDTTVRLKLNLWGNDSGKTALALLPYFQIPTGADGLGNDNLEGGFVVPFSLELPAGFYFGFTTQIAKLKARGEIHNHTEYRNSVSLARALFGNLEGYVEFFSAVSTEQDTQWIGTFNSGLAYWLTDDLQLNADVDIGVTRWADDWYFSLGMAWRY